MIVNQEIGSAISTEPCELVDIESVKIDRNLPLNQRIEDYVSQIKNPYCFKVKGVTVKVKFSETNVTMEECLSNYFNSL